MIQSTTKPSGVPSVNGPSLWYHEKKGVLYSGFTGYQSSFGFQDPLPPITIWSFKPDNTGSGAWTEVIKADAAALNSLNRPCQPFQAYGGDSAWVLGGFMNGDFNQSGPNVVMQGIVGFDMNQKSFTNFSSVGYQNNSGAVIKGTAQYVPSFGPQGLYIFMGGSVTTGHADLMISYEKVSVFDPVTQEWWNQTTTGSAPTGREEYCLAGVNSTNGTYEM